MKSNIKSILVCLFLSVILAAATGMTALAATEKIDPVRISFSYDQTPKAGEAVGTFKATTTSKEFTVESAEYTNDVETWSIGDRPKIEVTLRAEDGYRFSYTTSSHFKLSGCSAEFIRAKTYESGDRLVLEAYFKYVEGKVDQADGLDWDGTYARWSELEGVKEYEVRLYRNKNLVTTITTKNRSYNFRSYITKAGDYTFRVRGIAKHDGKAGSWSDYSDESTFSQSEADRYGTGSWEQNQYGWWYRYSSGGYPTSTWKEINGSWYYFNQDGYMLTGWQQIGGYWYFLNSNGAMLKGWQQIGGRWYYMNSDGVMLTSWRNIGNYWYYMDPSGAMLTDWQYINGKWYYLQPNGVMLTGWQFINNSWYYLESSGARVTGWKQINRNWYYLDDNGIMLTGWQFINGKWYFLDKSGAMYANRMTPDGYYVDGSGVFVR